MSGFDESTLTEGPFERVNYFFGQLLGVDDFTAEQRYQRGKHALHHRSRSGAGVVWGLAVTADVGAGTVSVNAGMALDGRGRELIVAATTTVSLTDWVAASGPPDGPVTVDLVVVAGEQPARIVPTAVDDAPAVTRFLETASIELRLPTDDGPAPDFSRVRQFCGLDPVSAVEVVAALDEIATLPQDERPRRRAAWLQDLAADDVCDLSAPPAATRRDPDTGVRLARVDLVVARCAGAATINDVAVDHRARRTLLPSWLVAEIALSP